MKEHIYIEEVTELTNKQIETIKFKNGSKIQWHHTNDEGKGETPLNQKDFPSYEYFKSEYFNIPEIKEN